MACKVYNTTIHASTSYTPDQLLFRHKKNPLGWEIISPKTPKARTINQYIEDSAWFFEKAREKIIHSQEVANEQLRCKNGQCRNYSKYQKGDYIWLKYVPPVGDSTKFAPRWQGPFPVLSHSDTDVVTVERKGAPYSMHYNRTKYCTIPS